MDPRTAADAVEAVSHLTSRFMLDGATFARGGELGLDGLSFYVVGRGGALGDVDADVVSAAFVWFNPDAVRGVWEAGCSTLPPLEAAQHFAECGYAWGRDRIPADFPSARLAELAGTVSHAAAPACAPLFAAWRALPEPADPSALVIHHMNALRELRGALHGVAVLGAGLTPLEAVAVNSPHFAAIYGWAADLPDADAARPRWETAEATTRDLFARVLGVLDAAALEEFVELGAEVFALTA